MILINTTIRKFEKQGEKTGWTYIEIPSDIAQKIKPGNKKIFRVKGKLDNFSISQSALLPMGNGNFILPINSAMRKGIGKRNGDMLQVRLEEDKTTLKMNAELMICLEEDTLALNFFKTLPKSHQMYFSKWIDSAKTESTKTKRIVRTINALSKRWGYGEMLRAQKGVTI